MRRKKMIEQLRAIFSDSGMTGMELAEAARVSQSTVSNFLSKDVKLSTAEKIAKGLGITLELGNGRKKRGRRRK